MFIGSVWLSVLRQNPSVEELLVKIVGDEISGYRKATYKDRHGGEPDDFAYLPKHSAVRALGNYLRRQALSWRLDKPTYLSCLRVFSRDYAKPLPPLNWCFLHELVHDPETRSHSVRIASKQVQMSGSARRLMENYVAAVTEATPSVST